MSEQKSAEQRCRDLLEQCGIEDAQSMSAGDLCPLANEIAKLRRLERQAAGKPKQDCCCGWDPAASVPSETVLSILSISGVEVDCDPEVITFGDVRYVPEIEADRLREALALVLDGTIRVEAGRAVGGYVFWAHCPGGTVWHGPHDTRIEAVLEAADAEEGD